MNFSRHQPPKVFLYVLIVSFIVTIVIPSACSGYQQISAPLMTDSAGKMGRQAISSVYRILCPSKNRMGTGFLHKSGKIITAAHVVRECNPNDVFIILPQGAKVEITKIISDENNDIAILTPTEPLTGTALPLASQNVITIGAQVSTWGFPAGYNGRLPILSVGYIAGIDQIKTENRILVKRLVVNAAFNSGNSGGPLIDIDTGTVIGIVSSKLAPIPPYIKVALNALKESKYGLMFEKTKPDGTVENVSQSQILEEILQYLRSQTQLVVGMAVLPEDIKSFFMKNKIEP
jgi:S1-C subfamily serine protease